MSPLSVQHNHSANRPKDGAESNTGWVLARRVSSSGAVQVITIDSLPFRLGRSAEASLQLAFNAVSSNHAEIFEQDGRLMVRDLKSTNGTFVNGVRIAEAAALEEGSILQIADVWMHVRRTPDDTQDQQKPMAPTLVNDASDGALALTRFPDLIREQAITVRFEPVIDLVTGRPVAVLGIGQSRIFGLSTLEEMKTAAKRLNRERELCRLLRSKQLAGAGKLPAKLPLFVDVAPQEIADPADLLKSLGEIRNQYPDVEIHVNAPADACFAADSLADTRERLALLGMNIALDDFGDGQSRLVELTELTPYCVWFESRFFKNIASASSERLRLTKALVEMVDTLGARPGVKCAPPDVDADACRQLGFKLGHGSRFAP